MMMSSSICPNLFKPVQTCHIITGHYKSRAHTHIIHRSCHCPEKCNECGIIFKTKHSLEAHRAFVYKYVLKFNCTDCHKNFTEKPRRNRHVRQVHRANDTVVLACDLCVKTFATESGVSIHKAQVHGKKSISKEAYSMDIAIDEVLEKVRRGESIEQPVMEEFEKEEESGLKLPMTKVCTHWWVRRTSQNEKKEIILLNLWLLTGRIILLPFRSLHGRTIAFTSGTLWRYMTSPHWLTPAVPQSSFTIFPSAQIPPSKRRTLLPLKSQGLLPILFFLEQLENETLSIELGVMLESYLDGKPIDGRWFYPNQNSNILPVH